MVVVVLYDNSRVPMRHFRIWHLGVAILCAVEELDGPLVISGG
jgi:hypothetical protein